MPMEIGEIEIEVPFVTDAFSVEQLGLIGVITIQWNIIEELMDSVVHQLTGMSADRYALVTNDFSNRNRVSALRNLSDYEFKEYDLDLNQKTKSTLEFFDKCLSRRNSIVHGQITLALHEDELLTRKTIKDGVIVEKGTPVTVDSLMRTIDDFEIVQNALRHIYFCVRAKKHHSGKPNSLPYDKVVKEFPFPQQDIDNRLLELRKPEKK